MKNMIETLLKWYFRPTIWLGEKFYSVVSVYRNRFWETVREIAPQPDILESTCEDQARWRDEALRVANRLRWSWPWFPLICLDITAIIFWGVFGLVQMLAPFVMIFMWLSKHITVTWN